MTPFTANPKLKKARERLLELLASKDRGELVKHEEIEKILGIDRPAPAYYRIVRHTGRLLEESKGVSIIPEASLGYVLATHDGQMGLLAVRAKRAKRQIRRGKTSVEALPDEELSQHQQAVKNAYVDEGKSMLSDISKGDSLLKFIMRQRPGEPLKIVKRDEKTESA